jgi:hypothetical protein
MVATALYMVKVAFRRPWRAKVPKWRQGGLNGQAECAHDGSLRPISPIPEPEDRWYSCRRSGVSQLPLQTGAGFGPTPGRHLKIRMRRTNQNLTSSFSLRSLICDTPFRVRRTKPPGPPIKDGRGGPVYGQGCVSPPVTGESAQTKTAPPEERGRCAFSGAEFRSGWP